MGLAEIWQPCTGCLKVERQKGTKHFPKIFQQQRCQLVSLSHCICSSHKLKMWSILVFVQVLKSLIELRSNFCKVLHGREKCIWNRNQGLGALSYGLCKGDSIGSSLFSSVLYKVLIFIYYKRDISEMANTFIDVNNVSDLTDWQ